MPQSKRRLAQQAEALVRLGPRPPWWRVFARRQWKRRHAEIMAMDTSVMAEILVDIYTPRVVERAPFRFSDVKIGGSE